MKQVSMQQLSIIVIAVYNTHFSFTFGLLLLSSFLHFKTHDMLK